MLSHAKNLTTPSSPESAPRAKDPLASKQSPALNASRRAHACLLTAASLLAAILVFPSAALSQGSSRSSSLAVVPPTLTPEAAQMPAESMFLHANSDGSTYLYLEQHRQNRIVVLDVTHPAHILQVSVATSGVAAFDFIRALGPSSALVCFRDGSGSGVMQWHNAKKPMVTPTPDLKQAAHTEELGAYRLLVTNGERVAGDVPEHDVQIVDLSTPDRPAVLATVRNVHQQVSDPGTGAHYLLGTNGLTVVRQPEVENQSDLAKTLNN